MTGDTSGLSRAFEQASKAGNSFGSSMAKVGKIAALGLAVGVGVAAVAITKSVKAALDAEQAQTRLDAAFKHASTSAKQQQQALEAVNKVSVKSGLDDEALSDSLTRLTQVTGDAEKATTGMGLAADIARGRGIELEAATGIVTKAMLGNVGALKRIGIEIPKVTAAQDALKESHKKATEEQKKAAKAADDLATRQGALAALQKKFGGDAEAYGQTASGAMDRFKVAIENVQEGLGAALLPALAGAAGAAADFLDKFNNAEGASEKFGVVMDTIKTSASAAWTSLKTTFDSIDWNAVGAKIGSAASAVKKAFDNIDWAAVASKMQTEMNRALDNLTITVKKIKWPSLGQSITDAIREGVSGVDWPALIVKFLKFDLLELKVYSQLVANLTVGLIRGVAAAISQVGSKITGLSDGLGNKIVDGIKAGMAGLAGKVGEKLTALGQQISGWAGSAYAYAFKIGSSIIDGIIGGLGGLVGRVGGAIARGLRAAIPFGGANVGSTAAEYAEKIIGITIPEGIADGITKNEQKMADALSASIKSAVDKAAKQLENAKDQFSGAAGRLSSSIQSAFGTLTDNPTKSEAKIQALQKAEEQKRLVQARSDAIAAQQAATTDEEKKAADEQFRQAELALTIAHLTKLAEQERIQQDAINTVRSNALQTMLDNTNTKFEEGKISYQTWHKTIMQLLSGYIPNWKKKGGDLGNAFVTELGKEIEKAAKMAKKLAEAYTVNIKVVATAAQFQKVVDGARAAGGPVGKGKTYLVGENGPELFTAASSGTIIPNGGTARAAGGGVTNVFNFPNYVGSKQELINMLRTETNRAASRNG